MKIGILTFHFSDNYGALLQAFCLQEYLKSIGHVVEFINYHPYYVEQGGSIREILQPAISRRYLKKVYLFLNSKRQKFLRNASAIAGLEDFRQKMLYIFPILARSSADLHGQLRSYDHVILGSDQIWNPSDQYGPDPVYFGFPFSADIPVSSYAASFGSIDRIKPYSDLITPFLQSLSHCSVREHDGLDYVSSIGIDATLVPDPTLLVDSLSAYQRAPAGVNLSDSIFTYALRSCSGVKEAALDISKALGLQVFSAYTPWRRWSCIGTELLLDPFTFLGSINASKLVISNSFHGIVSSILLRKQFIAVALPGSRAGLSSRVYSFLHSVGLEDRLIFPGGEADSLQILNQEINWSSVWHRILLLQDQGRRFLQAAVTLPYNAQ